MGFKPRTPLGRYRQGSRDLALWIRKNSFDPSGRQTPHDYFASQVGLSSVFLLHLCNGQVIPNANMERRIFAATGGAVAFRCSF